MSDQIAKFRKIVWEHYRKNGRHDLPWRKTKDAYKIMVSEVMLQQTQVERVIPFYTQFTKQFPTPARLARAPLSDVLRSWQGLGYNSRAKRLRQAAQEIVTRHAGRLPHDLEALKALSGIGPYTAGAMRAFAFNTDGIFIETNIRTVITHHFFPKEKKIPDEKILTVLKRVYPKAGAREWYSALMDYGAHLKTSGIRLNTKSKHYTKQKTFKGSAREARGMILRALLKKPAPAKVLISLGGTSRTLQFKTQLSKFLAEGLIKKESGKYHI